MSSSTYSQLSERSKKTLSKNASAHNRKMLDEGKAKRILLQLPTELAQEFDAVLAEFGGSRPQAIKALCEYYRANAKS